MTTLSFSERLEICLNELRQQEDIKHVTIGDIRLKVTTEDDEVIEFTVTDLGDDDNE